MRGALPRLFAPLAAFALVMVFATSVSAQRGEVTVPFNVGVGPAAFLLSGPVADDQTFHFGAHIQTFAVLDRATRRKYRNRIPRRYRKISDQSREIRYNPLSFFVPSSIFISPKIGDTGVYGLTMRPLGVGFAIPGRSLRFDLGVGVNLTYAYIHSETLSSPTHFLRPGIDGRASVEWPVVRHAAYMSIGWASTFYPPQEVGGSIIEWGDVEKSVWHIGQAFLLFHFRFPYTTRL